MMQAVQPQTVLLLLRPGGCTSTENKICTVYTAFIFNEMRIYLIEETCSIFRSLSHQAHRVLPLLFLLTQL